jgi:predicted nucleic acid-binding protein
LIYLDTNVYSRPFDDQTQPNIQEEANAFLEIVSRIKIGRLALLCSDILGFEVYNILNKDKRSKVENYLGLCTEHVEGSEEILNLGKRIQSKCQVRARDALHIASAILGGARYFLSCDQKVTQMKQGRCYRHLGRALRREYFSVMNPIVFVEKTQKGGLE